MTFRTLLSSICVPFKPAPCSRTVLLAREPSLDLMYVPKIVFLYLLELIIRHFSANGALEWSVARTVSTETARTGWPRSATCSTTPTPLIAAPPSVVSRLLLHLASSSHRVHLLLESDTLKTSLQVSVVAIGIFVSCLTYSKNHVVFHFKFCIY